MLMEEINLSKCTQEELDNYVTKFPSFTHNNDIYCIKGNFITCNGNILFESKVSGKSNCMLIYIRVGQSYQKDIIKVILNSSFGAFKTSQTEYLVIKNKKLSDIQLLCLAWKNTNKKVIINEFDKNTIQSHTEIESFTRE